MRGLREGWTKHPGEWLLLLAALALVGIAVVAPRAHGSFHEVKIRQIHPDNSHFNMMGQDLGGEWVELQMYTSGQNVLNGNATIRTFFGDGNLRSQYNVSGTNPPNSQSQRYILISSLISPEGVNADFVAPVEDLQMTGQDGAVCFTYDDASFTPIDCVAYGNFNPGPATPGNNLPVGTPAVATPFESTLERTIAPNCPTLLENSDDTDNSSTDFAISSRTPRNNATTPPEMPCPPGPPPAPTVTDSDPDSPANDNNPEIKGNAQPGTTVTLYTNSTCTSPIAASGSAASFASPGITVSVPDNSSTTFFATATPPLNGFGPSPCSTPPGLTYTEVTPPPPPPPPILAPAALQGVCKGQAATLTGTAANDVLVGTPRKDVIAGLEGNDTLRGLSGKDLLCGGLGDDKLIGGNAKDTLLGEGGNDTCKGGKAKDVAKTCEVKKSI